VVWIWFNRAAFYTGEAARKHNHGVAPDPDYLIQDSNPLVRYFTVDSKASLIAEFRLRNRSDGTFGRQALTAGQFVANATDALNQGSPKSPIPVWLRHSGGQNGPVTALSEQYLP
jgi:hypothetical protein